MPVQYLNPRNSVAFRKVFGTEENKDILIALLNAVVGDQLEGKIENVKFLKSVQEPASAARRQSTVDVLCRDGADNCYVIEMQVVYDRYFQEPAHHYACEAYTSKMKKGDPYEGLQKVIFLAFADFILYPEKEAYKSEHITFGKNTMKNNLDKISFTFVELPKFSAQVKQQGDRLEDLTEEEKFYYFLAHADDISPEAFEKLISNSPVIESAFKQVAHFYWI